MTKRKGRRPFWKEPIIENPDGTYTALERVGGSVRKVTYGSVIPPEFLEIRLKMDENASQKVDTFIVEGQTNADKER